MTALLKQIQAIPEGYCVMWYRNKKYGVTRGSFNAGKSIKLYAEELGGKDFISLNYYITAKSELLKPCEMPEQTVVDFLSRAELFCPKKPGNKTN